MRPPLPCLTSPKPPRSSVVGHTHPPQAPTHTRTDTHTHPHSPPTYRHRPTDIDTDTHTHTHASPSRGETRVTSRGRGLEWRAGRASPEGAGPPARGPAHVIPAAPAPARSAMLFLPSPAPGGGFGWWRGPGREQRRRRPLPAGRYRPAWRSRPLLLSPPRWPLPSGPVSRGGLSGRGFSLRPPLGGEGAAFPRAALPPRQPWGEGAAEAEGSGRELTGVSLLSFLSAFRLLQRSLLRPPPLSELCPLPAALPGACSVAAACEPPGSGTGDLAAPAPRSAPCRGRGWRGLRALFGAGAGGWGVWRDRASRDSGAGGGFFGKRLLPDDSQPAHGQSPAPWG